MTFTHITSPGGFPQEFLDTMHEAVAKAAPPANPAPLSSDDGRPSPSYAPSNISRPSNNELTEAINRRLLTHPELQTPIREWQTTLGRLLQFCREQQLPSARDEFMHLELDPCELTKKKICVLDLLKPDCKGELEGLAHHVWNEAIPLERRRKAVTKVCDLGVCVIRLREELRKSSLDLGAYLGGLSGEASQAFVMMCNVHLKDLLRQESRIKEHDVESVHVLQPFLKALRLPGFYLRAAKSDGYALDIRAYGDVLERCAAEMARRTNGMAIADWLAELCLREATEMLEKKLNGVTPDFWNGPGHVAALEDVVRQLALRFGPLNPLSFCTLDDEWAPKGLTDRHEMLAIDMRRKLTQECKFAPPVDRVLHRYHRDGAPHSVGLIDGRPYVRIDDPGGGCTICRPLTQRDAGDLLDPGPTTGQILKGPVLDDEAREVLRDHVVKQGRIPDERSVRRARSMAWHFPSPERVGHIIGQLITDDDTLSGWMNNRPETWDAATLDTAFHEILGCSHRDALGKLLRQWRATGFPDAWLRQVRKQAMRIRAEHGDTRIKGLHASGTLLPADRKRFPQDELLSRIEGILGQEIPLRACRQAARDLATTYPVGKPARDGIAGASLDKLGVAIDGLRGGPGYKLFAPVLLENGGMAAALESALYTSEAKFKAELDLVRRFGETFQMSSEDIGALLQVTSDDRFPVPFPVVGAMVLLGRPASYLTAVFRWTRQLYNDGLLDAATVHRILVPDTLMAEHAETTISQRPVAIALGQYLEELGALVEAGILSMETLDATTGLAGGLPCPLIRSALRRGEGLAAKRWEEWRSRMTASAR